MQPFDRRMSSASGVVGPLAASAMIFALTRGRVFAGDHALERRRHQDVDRQLEELLVRDPLAVAPP